MSSHPIPRRAFLVVPAAVLVSPRARAAEDVLARIVQARAALRTLRASFTQERTLGLLASTVTSRGELILVRPDRLRWHLDPPDQITYWVTPGGLAYATATSHGGVPRDAAGAMGVILQDMLAMLGGDVTGLRERYGIAADKRDDGATRLTIEPRDPQVAKRVRRIVVELDPDLVSPREIVLEESDTDSARIRFADVQRNVPVDPALMRP